MAEDDPANGKHFSSIEKKKILVLVFFGNVNDFDEVVNKTETSEDFDCFGLTFSESGDDGAD